MGTIVSSLFLSFDGVAEIDPGWHFPYFDQNMGRAVAGDYEDVERMVLGRVTYDSFAGAWPEREAAGGDDAGFAALIGDTPKLVATRGEQDLGWRNVDRTDDVVAAVRELRTNERVGKVLIAGSVSVVQELLAAGLLDEIRLLVHPVVAGSGTRLFEGSTFQPLKLISSEAFPTGVVRMVYAPAELPAAATADDVPGTGAE